jgi:methylmalonyl-CoA mutase
MSSNTKNLFSEFNTASKEQWKTLVQKESGKDFLYENIITQNEGLSVEPYYTKDEVQPSGRVIKTKNDWQIKQNFIAEDFKATNRKILKALENGVSALGISVNNKITANDLVLLLNGVYLNMISVHFSIQDEPENTIVAFVEFCNGLKINTTELNGSFNYTENSKQNVLQTFSLIEKYQAVFPNFKFITIQAENTSIVKEVTNAFQQLQHFFSASNFEKKLLVNTIQFKVFIGTEYFFEIAKLRAYRLLWQNLLAHHNLEITPAFIQAEKSWKHNDETDAHKNILRHTTEAMSAAVGGCDVLCLQSNDTTEQLNNDFFNRIAVNIQHLLKEESHFDKVTDIAAGSYYIEAITQQIVEKVWENIQN